MASTMASTLPLSRPSEKFGTHSTSVDIGQKHSRAAVAKARLPSMNPRRARAQYRKETDSATTAESCGRDDTDGEALAVSTKYGRRAGRTYISRGFPKSAQTAPGLAP